MAQEYNESTWAVLAGVRFLLAVIVLVGHLSWFTDLSYQLTIVKELGGIASVLGFLIISGISIGHSYTKQPKEYFKRRFLRIYPLYFFSICIPQLLMFIVGSPYTATKLTLVTAHWKTVAANLFFLQGFCTIPISSNIPVWSLSIEVFYYILTPYLVKCRISLLLILIAVSMSLYYLRDDKYYFIFGYDALCYAWPWLIGFIFSTKASSKFSIFLLSAGILIVASKAGAENTDIYSWLNFGLVSTFILLMIRFKISLSKTSQSILNFFGEISFPLYLFHVPLFLFWFHFFNIRNPWLLIGLACISTLPLSYVFDYWLKHNFWKPLVNLVTTRLQKRWFIG